ncbi:Hypothetical predicted protein [Lecanosticta acicola]|uniref:Mid2 domain-containing protein n=1 Tax=Lecanosticta acicola TaxID=111012 RepID=A0AAI8YV77_9PEZI|nr:Hypothetical predicted protein [Lecanosticta acicola]
MAALSVLLGALNATNLANTTNGLNVTNLAGISPLAFISPTSDATTYNTSQQINVTWTTPFEFTTVRVFQGPLEDGSYVSDILAANFTRNMTSLWREAGAVMMANLSAPLHFQLQKGHQPNDCDACVLNSVQLRISNASVPATMSQAAAEATAPAAAVPARMDDDSRTVRLGVGIGVGLGLGFLILIGGVMLLALRRRKQRRQARERELEERRLLEAVADKQRHSSGTESWMTGMTHKQFEFEGPDGTPREGWESLFGGGEGLRRFLSRKASKGRGGIR